MGETKRQQIMRDSLTNIGCWEPNRICGPMISRQGGEAGSETGRSNRIRAAKNRVFWYVGDTSLSLVTCIAVHGHRKKLKWVCLFWRFRRTRELQLLWCGPQHSNYFRRTTTTRGQHVTLVRLLLYVSWSVRNIAFPHFTFTITLLTLRKCHGPGIREKHSTKCMENEGIHADLT